MKLTGLDIQLKEFSKSLRGYDTEEVKRFLDEVARCFEGLDYENKVLKDKLREKELMLLEYREREGMMKDTMVTANKVTENIKKDATKESLQIITQAKLRAENVMREARQTMKKTLDEINMLRSQKMELSSNLRSMLETQIRMLNRFDAEKDNTNEMDDTVTSYRMPVEG